MMMKVLLIKLNDVYSLHREFFGDDWLYHALFCDAEMKCDVNGCSIVNKCCLYVKPVVPLCTANKPQQLIINILNWHQYATHLNPQHS